MLAFILALITRVPDSLTTFMRESWDLGLSLEKVPEQKLKGAQKEEEKKGGTGRLETVRVGSLLHGPQCLHVR